MRLFLTYLLGLIALANRPDQSVKTLQGFKQGNTTDRNLARNSARKSEPAADCENFAQTARLKTDQSVSGNKMRKDIIGIQ
jgi:hypothetical protein